MAANSPSVLLMAWPSGDQQTGIGGLRGYEAAPETTSIEIINLGDRSRTPFLSAPAAFPEFFPFFPANCNPNSLGDLDGNGQVNFADFLTLSANFGSNVASHREGDINCDGTVSFADFLTLSGNFGRDVGIVSVPEPSFNGLVLLVLLAVSLRRQVQRA